MEKYPVRPTRSLLKRSLILGFLLLLHVLPLTALRDARPVHWWTSFALFYVGQLTTAIGLHRYFSHRCFKTGRIFQLLLGVAASGAFADPIGFAGRHRLHHRYADTPEDVHSPTQGWWFCWIASLADDGRTDDEILAQTRDWARFPELLVLHRYSYVPGVLLGLATWMIGGYAMFAIGFCLSRVAMLHTASAVNYLGHRFGSRRYPTRDNSRNSFLLALVTVGEGWHHNHHHYPPTARAGFFWWEVDPSYYVIRLLGLLGLVWDIREVPPDVRSGARARLTSSAAR